MKRTSLDARSGQHGFGLRHLKDTWSTSDVKRDAFTLIELIVVVGTLALLVGILLPAYATSGRKAGIVECKNNLRQVGTAIDAYSNDHTNSLPGPMWTGCYYFYQSGGETPMPYTTAYYLAPYFGLPPPDSTERVVPALICPASSPWLSGPHLQIGPFSRAMSYIQCLSVTNYPGQLILSNTPRPFGYPPGFANSGPPVKAPDIRRPSEQWAITDVDLNNAPLDISSIPCIPPNPVHNNRAGGPRQMARRNYLYFDWSVRSVETPQ